MMPELLFKRIGEEFLVLVRVQLWVFLANDVDLSY